MLKRLRRPAASPSEPSSQDAWSLLRTPEPAAGADLRPVSGSANDAGLSPEAIVIQLFEGIVGRAATPGDIEHYAALLRRHPEAAGLQTLARVLSNAGETRARLAQDPRQQVLDKLPPVPRRFETVVSFGTHCYSAKLMQMTGNRKFSTPLDWVFSTPEMIAHCLQDDFRTFLDPRHHFSIAGFEDKTRAEHLLYKQQFGVESLFNHRDPNEPGALAYLQRGARRLLDLLDGDTPFLCLMATRPWITSEAQFQYLAGALSRRSRHATLACIRIWVREEGPRAPFGHHQIDANGPHRLYDYHPASQFEPLGFENQLDDIAIMRWVRMVGA